MEAQNANTMEMRQYPLRPGFDPSINNSSSYYTGAAEGAPYMMGGEDMGPNGEFYGTAPEDPLNMTFDSKPGAGGVEEEEYIYGDGYQRPMICMGQQALLFVAIVLTVLGALLLLVGFLAMSTDSNRNVYESFDNVFKAMMEKMNRRYRRERYGYAYLGFGMWLGGAIFVTGIVGIVDYVVKGAARVFYIAMCGFSVICCLGCVVLAAMSLIQEEKLCESMLYEGATFRACDGPYSTTRMKSWYSLELMICAAVLIALVYNFFLAHFNRYSRPRKSLKGAIREAGGGGATATFH